MATKKKTKQKKTSNWVAATKMFPKALAKTWPPPSRANPNSSRWSPNFSTLLGYPEEEVGHEEEKKSSPPASSIAGLEGLLFLQPPHICLHSPSWTSISATSVYTRSGKKQQQKNPTTFGLFSSYWCCILGAKWICFFWFSSGTLLSSARRAPHCLSGMRLRARRQEPDNTSDN